MKRCMGLLLALLLALPAALAEEPTRFEAAELSALTPAYGMSRAQAKEALGEPNTWETTSDGANVMDRYQYPQATLTFLNDLLVRAEWEREDWGAPRGLTVGMSEEDVLAVFCVDDAQKESFILYESGYVPTLNAYLPPCGVVGDSGDGTREIVYQAPLSAYPASVADAPASYADFPHATLNFRISALTRRVIAIAWTVSPLKR